METQEIVRILLLIPLILAVIFLPKFFKTPNSKLNYIIAKYQLKTFSCEDLENLLNQEDSKVPKRDKDLIKKLLKE